MPRLLALLVLAWPALASAAPPSKAEVKAAAPGTRPTEVFPDLGGGRFPFLYTVKDKDCSERKVDRWTEKSCSSTSLPGIGVVKRAADGALTLEGKLALPVEAPPWDIVEPFAWGINVIKDHDGDGKPEMMLAYGYNGPMVAALGDIHYKHWCIVNLDTLTLAIHVVQDQLPQATVTTQIESKWKLVPRPGGAPDVLITRRSGEWNDKKGARVWTVTKTVYKYDPAADAWKE